MTAADRARQAREWAEGLSDSGRTSLATLLRALADDVERLTAERDEALRTLRDVHAASHAIVTRCPHVTDDCWAGLCDLLAEKEASDV